MKNIEIGDLVRIWSDWDMDNPWMKGHLGQPLIGLITGISQPIVGLGQHSVRKVTAYKVLTEGREILLPPTRVEALCK